MNKPILMIALIGLVLVAVFGIGQIMRKDPAAPAPEAAKAPEKSPAKDAAPSDSAALEAESIPDIPNRPQGEKAKVNGIDLYYEVFGKGEPVLLIHGGAATIESWYAQIPEFSKGYQVIVPDARGHGRTPDADGPINFQLMAADFAGLLDHLGLKGVMVVGWSDGGVTGLELAMKRPELVKKVVTLGAHSRPEGMTAEFKAQVEAFDATNFPPILVNGYKALSPDGPDHWPVVFAKLKTMWLTLPNYQDDDLKAIRCPVLLVAGEHDIVREEESKRMAALIPKARLKILEGMTHYAPIEKPDAVNREILTFLQEP